MLRCPRWMREAEQTEISQHDPTPARHGSCAPREPGSRGARGRRAGSLDARARLASHEQPDKLSLVEALEAALALGDLDSVGEHLSTIESSRRERCTAPPGHGAGSARFSGAARTRTRLWKAASFSAEATFRELDMPFYLAVTQLEHAEWLAGQDRRPTAEQLLAEARETSSGSRRRPGSSASMPRRRSA